MEFPYKLSIWYESSKIELIGGFKKLDIAMSLAESLEIDMYHPQDGFLLIEAPEGRYILGHERATRRKKMSGNYMYLPDGCKWIPFIRWYRPGETAYYTNENKKTMLIAERY